MLLTCSSEGWSWLTTGVPYCDDLRKQRSYEQRFIGSPETLGYLDVQLSATHAMLKAILDDPTEYGTHMLKYESLPFYP